MDFSFFLLEALLDQRTSNCFWYISSSNNESGNLPNRSLFITTHWSLQVCRIRNERSRLERLVGLNDCSELYQKSSSDGRTFVPTRSLIRNPRWDLEVPAITAAYTADELEPIVPSRIQPNAVSSTSEYLQSSY